jgi:DNA polymerase III subunit epsilon
MLFIGLLAGLELGAALALYHHLKPEHQQHLAALLIPHTELIAELGLLRLMILGGVFVVAYQAYVKGALKIAEGIRIILNANPGHRLTLAGPPELNRLARAANALAEHSEELTRDLEARITQAKASVEEEKNRLAALMSELSQGVLVCNLDGRILLYNERARHMFDAPATAPGPGTAPLIGLGRSIFSIIDRNLLVHELENVQTRLDKREANLYAQFVITTRSESGWPRCWRPPAPA